VELTESERIRYSAANPEQRLLLNNLYGLSGLGSQFRQPMGDDPRGRILDYNQPIPPGEQITAVQPTMAGSEEFELQPPRGAGTFGPAEEFEGVQPLSNSIELARLSESIGRHILEREQTIQLLSDAFNRQPTEQEVSDALTSHAVRLREERTRRRELTPSATATPAPVSSRMIGVDPIESIQNLSEGVNIQGRLRDITRSRLGAGGDVSFEGPTPSLEPGQVRATTEEAEGIISSERQTRPDPRTIAERNIEAKKLGRKTNRETRRRANVLSNPQFQFGRPRKPQVKDQDLESLDPLLLVHKHQLLLRHQHQHLLRHPHRKPWKMTVRVWDCRFYK